MPPCVVGSLHLESLGSAGGGDCSGQAEGVAPTRPGFYLPLALDLARQIASLVSVRRSLLRLLSLDIPSMRVQLLQQFRGGDGGGFRKRIGLQSRL